MIRRIVDSVSLLTDPDEEQLSPNLRNGTDSPKPSTMPNGTKITLRNRSASSSGSSDLVDVKYTNLFSSCGPLTTMSNSGSCYIAPKDIPEPCTPASCDENPKTSRSPSPIPARRQSPSPGRVDPSCVASRQLPGGGLSLQQRVQRIQPARKKEHSKGIGPVSKSSKSMKSNKTGKSEEFLSTYEEEREENGFSGMASQADPLVMSVECYVLPFMQDLKAIELRIPAFTFSKAQRRILKMLANENELLILSMGKPGVSAEQEESAIVIRKRAALQQRQEIQWEKEQREAAERARIRAEEEERKRKEREREELIRTNQFHQSAKCQANLEDPEPTIGRKKARRLRRLRHRQTNKRPIKPKRVDSEMQTVPEDHWLCPWCWQHIPPEQQCGHEVVCRAGVRLKQREQELKARLNQRNADAEARRRQRLGLPPLKTPKKQQQPGLNGTCTVPGKTEAPSGRSRSRTRNPSKSDKTKGKATSRPRSRSASKTDPRNQTSVVAKLETVHPNDLDGMAKLMQRVCSQPGCDQIYDAGDPATRCAIKCLGCRLPYCDRHRPAGMHNACPAPEKPVPPPKPGLVSAACGWDIEEKRAALKSAIRERRSALQERRQRY